MAAASQPGGGTLAAPITRLAPSPTGTLHLGNARTFLVNWALARKLGWRIILRIEDLDGPRIKPGAAEAIASTLRWLGMDWDGDVLIQSHDLAPYHEAMSLLASKALVYPSDLSRTQIEAAASAPQEGSGEVVFPPSLRPVLAAREFDAPEMSWRFATPAGEVEFTDGVAGPQRIVPQASIGDFAVWTKRGTPAYQLSVVVDDHRQGVTEIVRGDDLLDSAARQILLYRALGLGPAPRYAHLPLVVGTDAKRLAKRHGDSRVEHYRAMGVTAERIIGLVAFWSGCCDRRQPMSAAELVAVVDLRQVPKGPVVFTAEDEAWLIENT